MKYPFKLPHTITNPFGECLTFEKTIQEKGGKKMLISNKVKPGAGPPFHVHHQQEEHLTVTSGTMGYQIEGEDEQFLHKGDSATFPPGVMHRFWNAGKETLECTGYVYPANSLDYFLTGIYQSMNKTGTPQGDPFDTAFLMTRYRSEYDLKDIPRFVKRVIFPITVWLGKRLGKYKHFQDAPPPIA